MRLRTAGLGLLICLLFLVGGLLAVESLPDVALAQGVTNFDSVTVSGDLIAGDDITAGDDVTAADDVVVGNWNRYTAQTGIVVAQSGYITPTGTYQPISAAASIGTRLVATRTFAAGYVLVLINTGSNTVTLTDTAPLALSGNAALGQYDSIVMMFDGTRWVQIAPEGDN